MMKVISSYDSDNSHMAQYHRMQQQQQQHHMQHMMHPHDSVKVEGSYGGHMSPSMGGMPQRNSYFSGNQPNSYFQSGQQPQGHQMNYPPQSPNPSSPHPMGQGSVSDGQTFNSNSVNLSDLNTLTTPALLEKIYRLQRSQKDDLNKIRQYQKQVMVSPTKSSFDMLDQQHRQMKEQIDTEV